MPVFAGEKWYHYNARRYKSLRTPRLQAASMILPVRRRSAGGDMCKHRVTLADKPCSEVTALLWWTGYTICIHLNITLLIPFHIVLLTKGVGGNLTPWRSNWKAQQCAHNSPPPVPILSQLHPLYSPNQSPKDQFWSHLRLGLQSGLFPSDISSKENFGNAK
jgi:hypothetical protein